MEQQYTWDGLPVAPDPPFGASIIVFRRAGGRIFFLVLHRAQLGPDFEGDWAWGPPAGARLPGENIDNCARRELAEETGLDLPLRPSSAGTFEWAAYLAEAPMTAEVQLSAEHDRWGWLPLEDAVRRCLPSVVAEQLRHAAEDISDL